MSAVENTNCDIGQQQSNETPPDAEEKAHHETPALDSSLLALQEIVSEKSDVLTPETLDAVPTTQNIANELQSNVDKCLETVSENLELTNAEIEHFANFEDLEEIDSSLLHVNSSKQAESSVETIDNKSGSVDMPEESPKEKGANSNNDAILSNVDLKQEVNSSSSQKKIQSPLKSDENIKAPLKDDVQKQTEASSNQQKDFQREEIILDEKNKEEPTPSSTETLTNKTNNDQTESCKFSTKNTDGNIITKENEVEKKVSIELENEGDVISKVEAENIKNSETVESDDGVEKPGTLNNEIEMECDGIPTSVAIEHDVVEKNFPIQNANTLKSVALENETSEAMETDDIPKIAEEDSKIASTSVTIETKNITETAAVIIDDITKSVAVRDGPISETVAVGDGDISEAVAEQSNEIRKSSDKEDDVTLKSTITESDDKVKEIQNIETSIEEPVEPMDTYDSQESINLVIDEETSNITENKTDEETNMDVDLNENATEKSQKPAEAIEAKTDNSSELAKEPLNPEPKTAVERPNENEYILNKSKDDDVIPIEQPPVPVIEIEDEEEIEPDKKATISKINEQSSNCKDHNLKESATAKGDNGKEKISTSKSLSKESEEILLDKSSETPVDDDIITPDTPKSTDENEETNDEVYYNKECINYECPHKHKQYFKVPQFAFSYFKVTKKKFKTQYICADCYDKALEMYEEFCGLITAKQPLLLENIPSGRQEFVEIIDSSDDEESCSNKTNTVETTKTAFSKNDLTLIKTELNDTIKAVLNRVDIQHQLTWSKTILTERLKRLEMETEYVDTELKAMQRKADKMHEGLYSCPKIKIRQLQPLDLNSGKLMSSDLTQKEVQPVPPVGEIERPSIQQNGVYYAVKNNPIASWVPCRIIEQVENSLINSYSVKHYKIKFTKNQTLGPKTVSAKYLAYYDPPAVRLPIGTRVIAYFDATSLARGREKINVQSAFYPGIIAEPLKPNNKFRYLIFYDDGYTQYVYHKDVRLVCHVSDCVWEDVHPASRDFIQKYLTQYSINRPMVQTQKGQSMNTESNGYWLHARVVDIDCSLVLMQFEGSKSHTEWIYRGSLRLGPVFKEYQKSLQKNSPMPVSRLPRRTEPFIRYTEDEETSSTQQQQQQQSAEKSSDGSRAVARKTFGRPESMMNSAQPNTFAHQQQQPVVKHLNNSTIYVEDENKPKGKVVYYTAKRNLPPRKYRPHKCAPSCQFQITHNLSAYSPLSKPLLSGWERFILRQKIKRVVTYRAPCGKILRNMKELHHYLRATKNALNVDNFDFSHEISCLAEYVIESAIIQKRDISGGQEKMAIPLVNYYDNTLPPECKYSAKVIPTEGVHINTDPEFLVGCDCEDDCIDKSKCACWQLTLAGAKYGNPNAAPEEVGYQYRRLLDHVPTGIYECNANCKCKSSCLNRVVQNSLTMKLQVFKTSNRGWGLRCINDIPRGSFVCVYAGHLLTEAKANEGGQDAGDEYFAELDYIEVAEQIKEGYESDVEPPEPEEEEPYNPELDDDGDFTPSKSFLTRAKQKQNALKSTRPNNQEEDSQERQVINFNPNADMNEDSVRESSIRKLYGKDEACYVMDAKISGNLGRYFNHSCAPNMFVQNVFVDTHDLRFPNVAFFSSCNIRAGTELTWNYNYEVGVVPGKVLYCQCGASNCRLRLL